MSKEKKEQKFVTDNTDVLMFGASLGKSFYQSNNYSDAKYRRVGITFNNLSLLQWQR